MLRGLAPVEGSKFVLLTKDKYSDLCRCLLGASQRRSMMGKTRVFQDITALRNAACNQLTAELVAASNEEPSAHASSQLAEEGGDVTTALGFDEAPAAVERPTKRPRAQEKRKIKAARLQLPSVIQIEVPARLGLPARQLRVLCETGTDAKRNASMELTAGNLEWLRAVVHAEVSAGGDAPSPSASKPSSPSSPSSSASRRSPQGRKGNREYFVPSRNRWVRKRLVQGGKDGVRRYRVLTRRPTPVDQPAALPRCLEGSSRASEGGQEEDLTAALCL